MLWEQDALRRLRDNYVIELHFVCRRGESVEEDGPGHFWSGDWWVDEEHARLAARVGAKLALHEEKSLPSYRQGDIIDWRQVVSDNPENTHRLRVRFRVAETDQPLAWAGKGSGEKGYRRGPAQRMP